LIKAEVILELQQIQLEFQPRQLSVLLYLQEFQLGKQNRWFSELLVMDWAVRPLAARTCGRRVRFDLILTDSNYLNVFNSIDLIEELISNAREDLSNFCIVTSV